MGGSLTIQNKNKESGKIMLKLIQLIIKRKLYVRYLPKKYQFFVTMTLKKCNFIKTKLASHA